MSNFINISILGASGYVGSEMIHLCLKHPNIKIQSLSANETAGEHVSKAIPGLRDTLDLKFSKLDEMNFTNIDFIFSCLPHAELQASLHKIPETVKQLVIGKSLSFIRKIYRHLENQINSYDFIIFYQFLLCFSCDF